MTQPRERRKSFRPVRIFLIMLVLWIPPAWSNAQDNDAQRDYYQAGLTRVQQELLHNVEKYHLQQGIDRMREGRLTRAQEEFNFILTRFPNHPRVLLLMGELAQKMEEPGLAHRYFTKALTLFPYNAATYLVYGIFLQRSDDIDGAVEQYRKALEKNPEYSEAHYNLGLALLARGKPELAREHAIRAYELGYPLPGLRDLLAKAGYW